MTYTVFLHPKAAKELKKLEAGFRTRIVEGLRELGEDPDGKGKRLSQSDFLSLRVGDYRVIYEIDPEKKRVLVLFVGHRSKVYDDFSKML